MERNRIASWWIRWADLDWPNQDNMDKIKRRAEGLAKADVSAAMIFGAHFRWDFLPIFPLFHDYIAAVAEELHKNGVKLFDHHSVNLIHRYSTREEMRRVMLDSGPHLPFSPTWEAAATWQYKGKYLNDWRMIDVKTGKPLYYPQYTSEGFCHRNPEFKEAYYDYVKNLIADTGIDGLSADDPMHYMHFNACGCKYCRAELKRRAGIDLPPIEDKSFWFNWDNEAWHHWVDLRFESTGEFCRDLAKVVPENFMLTGCGGSSAGAGAVGAATDARQFLRGCNYVNLEMSGNTPPYKHDPHTVNVPVGNRLTNASHHQAAAREVGATAFSTGFAHTTVAANHVWAVSKILDADAWIGTLKGRLGLPDHILNTLPEEKDIVGQAFGFEAKHADLFKGEFVGQLGVYFSYETRNHTMFGAIQKGYSKDYSDSLTALFRSGICPHTLFDFPENAEKYPLILLPSAARMTRDEIAAAEKYLASGGKIIATGPCALDGCPNSWVLPTAVTDDPWECFLTVPDGVHVKQPRWKAKTEVAPCGDANIWTQPRENLYYNPRRASEPELKDSMLQLCEEYMQKLPIKITAAKGYLTTMFEAEDQITVQFLAEDYDVDIDHELDKIRYHRSRVNLVNKVEPIGVDGILTIETAKLPEVYTPFNEEGAKVEMNGSTCTVTLPEKCSYAIARFYK